MPKPTSPARVEPTPGEPSGTPSRVAYPRSDPTGRGTAPALEAAIQRYQAAYRRVKELRTKQAQLRREMDVVDGLMLAADAEYAQAKVKMVNEVEEMVELEE